MFLNFSTANLKITRLNLKRSVFLHLEAGGKTWNDCLTKLDLYECKSGKVLVLNNVPFQVCQLCFKSLSLFLLILIVFRYLHAFLTQVFNLLFILILQNINVRLRINFKYNHFIRCINKFFFFEKKKTILKIILELQLHLHKYSLNFEK